MLKLETINNNLKPWKITLAQTGINTQTAGRIKKVNNLSNIEIKKIVRFTKKVISKAIILGGSSIKNFSSSSGKRGSFQQYFNVYGKKGEKCSNKKCKNIWQCYKNVCTT